MRAVLPASQPLIPISCLALLAFWRRSISTLGRPRRRCALANNPEIRVAMRRVAIAETRVRSAGSLSDPEFMYRGWGTPLAKPWDLNQTQHMFMFNQSLPGPGKRALRTQLASEGVDQVKAELEA